MVVHEGGGEPHWANSGQAAVSGLVMSLVTLRPESERNLVRLYQILTGPDFFPFVRWAMKSGHPLIANRLGRFAARKAEENAELRSIISTAITQLNFLGNTAIAKSLNPSGPSLRFSTLRETPSTVFLILPTKYLSACAKWFRLVVQSAMWELLREGSAGRVQCLAMLDEFAQLGVMPILSDMMGIGRGYGIQLWPVLQDLNQLVELYPKRWETFLGNAGAQLFFAPRDNFSARWISEKCGQSEIAVPRLYHSPVEMWQQEGREENPMGLGVHVDQIPRPLMLPHEVAYMGGDELLVFGENLGGIILGGRKSYLKTPEYAGMYDPDPYHAGATKSWWPW
jgi:type IV secretion system protein VirD4